MGSGEIATADTREKPEPNFSALSCMHNFISKNEVEHTVESDLKSKNEDDDWMFQMLGKPQNPEPKNFVKVDQNFGLDTYIDFMDQFIKD